MAEIGTALSDPHREQFEEVPFSRDWVARNLSIMSPDISGKAQRQFLILPPTVHIIDYLLGVMELGVIVFPRNDV